jgi:tRNA dimethylallyltransferase
MKAIGVREFSAALSGEMPLATVIEQVKTQTRRYSKRQNTWFRHQMPGWRRIRG